MYNAICFEKNNIRIRDIPLFLGDYAVHKLMETLNLNLTSKILYRDLCVWNLKPLLHKKHLTRINYCGSVQCNLYHFGQQKNPTNFLYRNCLKTNHKSSWRQKPVHTILPFLQTLKNLSFVLVNGRGSSYFFEKKREKLSHLYYRGNWTY